VNSKLFYIALALWIFAVVPMVMAESFPDRPTASEMEGFVVSGTHCVRGVNERCWATQYQTNPVAYQVAPFTNITGYYLDPNLMAQMASKIKSLVQYYVDPDTVYEGATNIVMLSVTGVWAQLEIGDYTNQFTSTPASGTNPPTYGDYPSQMYPESFEERCKALAKLSHRGFTRALNMDFSISTGDLRHAFSQAANSYDTIASEFEDTNWTPYFGGQYTDAGGYLDNIDNWWDMIRLRIKYKIAFTWTANFYATTKLSYTFINGASPTRVDIYRKVINGAAWNSGPVQTNIFNSTEAPAGENTIYRFYTISPVPEVSTNLYPPTFYGDVPGSVPLPSSTDASPWSYGWTFQNGISYYQIQDSNGDVHYNGFSKPLFVWYGFQYCTDE